MNKRVWEINFAIWLSSTSQRSGSAALEEATGLKGKDTQLVWLYKEEIKRQAEKEREEKNVEKRLETERL